MQNSSQPKLIPTPFADNGAKQNIPNDSQIGIAAGRASYVDGFPPLTRTPLAAGGVPPFGTDFNGVLNDITAAIRWSQSGAGYPFNSAFNTAISGYPKGARIPNSTLDGYWLNTIDGNTANPEATGSAITGWVPAESYGVTSISGLSGSSVTLTTLQASKERITLAGTLSANINVILPAWIKLWTVVNNCTGAFSVTVKTPSGTGVSIPAGSSAFVYGDGTNIVAALDATLAAIGNLPTAANKLPYFSAVDVAALTDLTSVGRDIIGKNTASDVLTYLGLGTAAKRNVDATLINGIPDMSSFRGRMTSGGYIQLPLIGAGGGGQSVIIQWGVQPTATNSNTVYNLSVAFPNTIFWANGSRGASGSNAAMGVSPEGTQQIRIQNWAPSGPNENCFWLAIGY